MTAGARAHPGAALRAEAGFTLMELMVAVSVGIIVVLAAFSLLDSSVLLTGKVSDRVDSTQRARLAMSQITAELRSEVCTTAQSAILSGGPNTLTFFEYTGSGALQLDKHTIWWDSSSDSLKDSDYGSSSPSSLSYPAQPISTRTLADNVWPEPAGSPPVYNTPVFTYYGFTTTGQVAPTLALSNPLNATDLPKVAHIAVKFIVRPSGRSGDQQGTTLEDDVYFRGWDPNAAGGPAAPQCL